MEGPRQRRRTRQTPEQIRSRREHAQERSFESDEPANVKAQRLLEKLRGLQEELGQEPDVPEVRQRTRTADRDTTRFEDPSQRAGAERLQEMTRQRKEQIAEQERAQKEAEREQRLGRLKQWESGYPVRPRRKRPPRQQPGI